jgi:hypothetical protein
MRVEYLSTTHDAWIPAQVLEVHPNGYLNLSVKRGQVKEYKVRMPTGKESMIRREAVGIRYLDNGPRRVMLRHFDSHNEIIYAPEL